MGYTRKLHPETGVQLWIRFTEDRTATDPLFYWVDASGKRYAATEEDMTIYANS